MTESGATQPGPGAVVALGSALILTSLAVADVGFRDSGELGAAGYVLGVAHPTGFAVDLLLLRAAALLPLGHVAFRQNLCTALAAAAALGLLASACDRLAMHLGVTQRWARAAGAVLAAAGLLGWQTFLGSALSVEVYSLALAAVLLALAGAARGGAASRLGLLVVGFAPGLHVTAGLYALLVCAGVAVRRSARRALAVRMSAAVPVAAGALIIAYLPLASLRDPPIDWGDPEDPSSVFSHLTAARIRSAFGSQMLGGESLAPLQVVTQLLELWPLLPLALLALASGIRRKPIAVLAPVVLFAADLAYAVWIHPMGAPERQVGHMAGAAVCLLAGVGAALACEVARDRYGARGVAVAAAASAVLAALAVVRMPGSELGGGHAAGELHGSGGPLSALPPRAILLCFNDDLCAASLVALHVEAVRPDAEVLPAQHLWDPTVVRRLRGSPDLRDVLPHAPPPERRAEAAHAVLLALLERAPRPVLLEVSEPLPGTRAHVRAGLSAHPPYFHPRTAGGSALAPQASLARLDRMRAARLPAGDPSSTDARVAWARAYGALAEQAMAHPGVSIRALRAAIDLAPWRAVPWTNLGVALETHGELDAAIDATRRALELEPTRATPWVNLVRLVAKQSGPQRAAEVLELARRAGVRDPRLTELARALSPGTGPSGGASGQRLQR